MSVIRIEEFDVWRAGYGLDQVAVYKAGTTDLADIFTDEALSAAADNPQTLEERTDGDISYGKFAVPLYVGVPYELLINSIDRTGVVRPSLTTLDGEDASLAVATATGGTEDFTLADHLARRIDVRDFGDFIIVGGPGASAATNQATLGSAIGAASAGSGGYVEMPAGTYAVTGGVTVPAGVVVRGAGRAATTLQSTLAGNVFIVGGDRGGFSRITLDGVTLVGSSVGLFAAAKNEIVLDDIEIKRFETGIYRKGGSRAAWREVYLSNCTNGAKLHGDTSSSGAALSFNHWRGGKVELCGTFGIEFKYVDAACEHNAIKDVVFDTNTGTAVKVTGARATELRHCDWTANTANLAVADATPVTTANTVNGLEITDGAMSGGTIALQDTLETVAFRRMTIASVTATLTAPSNNIHIEDCVETSVTIAGGSTSWRRHRTVQHNAAKVTTVDATPTKAWAITLDPGQHVRLEIKVVGRQRNGTNSYFSHKSVSASRPGSRLNYELQPGNFTVGSVITGGTSGASGRIVADTDAGTTGTLTLYDIVGAFVDDEIITDGSGGSATVNGTLVSQNAVVMTRSSLAYDGQSANFTAGLVVTGGTSGAYGTISSDADAGATGTLILFAINGAFIDNEALTDTGGGAAVVNGILFDAGVFLVSTHVGALDKTSGASSYVTINTANGAQIEHRVNGVANHTVDWTVDVEIVSIP